MPGGGYWQGFLARQVFQSLRLGVCGKEELPLTVVYLYMAHYIDDPVLHTKRSFLPVVLSEEPSSFLQSHSSRSSVPLYG